MEFVVFHAENPQVYALFKKFAFQAINAGRTRFSARMILERIRWYSQVETTDPKFKLNDHHTPYYARLFMRDHPEHGELFELRALRSEK